jgi:hypothetical protein
MVSRGGGMHDDGFNFDNTSIAKCKVCNDYSLWRTVGASMFYPTTTGNHKPNEDMPEDIKADFIEANNIVDLSPRGAAALLRLALQKLCVALGEKGKNINEDIGNLVKKGLPVGIQKALDNVRITGNSAVHPGEIDINANPEMAHALFGFINIITQVMISQPKQIDEFEALLPKSAIDGVIARDKRKE